MTDLSFSTALCAALGLALTGCAAPPPARIEASAAPQWHASQPHDGELGSLQAWWSQFDDPLLAHLVTAAQAASPTLATATANIADARAARVTGGAVLLPALDAGASASRSRAQAGAPLASQTSASVQASWELDLFGALRAGANAAQARVEAREADWHEARVSVAAEVASGYADLRACERQAQQLDADARSRELVADVSDAAARVGVRSTASADLARASAADGYMALLQQQAQCALLVKSLVALTAEEEMALRRQLTAQTARLPRPREFAVAGVPAALLAQRPDVRAAEREVVAASAEVKQAAARRWPRVTLAGMLGATRTTSLGLANDGGVWTLGPVTVTLPLFDAGVRRANTDAARARHVAALKTFEARLRTAIQEVESALVTLQSAAQRGGSAQSAVDSHERAYHATAASHAAGAASLFELEDARRGLLLAQTTRNALERERLAAWISLYRAAGGGWRPNTPVH
ncbi:efflux transporter outer membrane subunit [Roseateles sp. LKC17W]|uniref:Efflux transporter outer membrane subunit n=1 Tax=Pelomonas margarita TaxID=3299031 RepID=A0ABW7FI87_9BURK